MFICVKCLVQCLECAKEFVSGGVSVFIKMLSPVTGTQKDTEIQLSSLFLLHQL